ncbi:thiamine pyrophosphate-dependent enzyme [Legionella lansingensis]|uniref:thiamine pyrophosphate-dependent enzyme n=1 Tax=Legionella lansingensis TaxID=45067 RepID=UPI0004907C1A|nr:thiamine pyrophosphate-dependent enzyme [Legionella lansingensis]
MKSKNDFFHLELNTPSIDVIQIALSFGAHVTEIKSVEDIEPALSLAFAFKGPTFIAIHHT